MVISAANKAEFEGVYAQILLPGEANFQALAHEIAFGKVTVRILLDRIGIFEISKLIGGPKGTMYFGIALDLHHLNQRLPIGAGLRIGDIERLAETVELGKHQTF